MTMPKNIVFVRHGESEANLIHKSERNGNLHQVHDAIYARHDWEHRLSEEGIEQAKITGKWLVNNGLGPNTFDRCYVSTYQRAIETALHIGDDSTLWHIDDRFRERNWSEFGATPLEERKKRFPYAQDSLETNAFYANLDGGESLSDVQMRIRDGIGTFHRDLENKNVLVVAHGEVMTVARYLIERMLPEEIIEADKDKSQQIKNCTILQYTRVNPENISDISGHISWMRMIYPNDEENSPFGGNWQDISEGRVRNGAELRKRLLLSPALTRKEVKI